MDHDEDCPLVPLGTIVNEHVIGKLLGNGAYSSVYLGTNKKTNREVAMKFVKDADAYRREQSQNEIRMLKKLSSVPTVINLISDGMWNDCIVLVLRLLGPDLDQLRPHGLAFQHGTILKIGLEIISTLEAIHKFKVIHRSIKDANICMKRLTDPKSPLVLIDYGMAATVEVHRGRVVPYKELGNDRYHLRSYAPLNIVEPNNWTFCDDHVMLGHMLLDLNADSGAFRGDSEEATNMLKKELVRDPHRALSEKSQFLAQYMEVVYSLRWRSIPKYANLRRVLSSAATKSSPIPKFWSYKWVDGKLCLI